MEDYLSYALRLVIPEAGVDHSLLSFMLDLVIMNPSFSSMDGC